ncbi:sugar transferase [Collinsella tanakaei]|uniref:sugar transferase n=1 Tax=Collinsella tanakaei TaxID=626935 RepID=UPI0029437836|nr:sugar transferase [Collinsella tanakaei]
MARNGSPFYRVCKRGFDIVFSACVLVAAAVPGAVLALMVCAESPGGPMFRQSRVGRGGREIRIWKLRSMYADAHEHPERYLDEGQMAQWEREQKVDGDPRVTRIGRFIRKTSLDEVPQFINVLAGDMSVIGPRPVTPEETYEFGDARDEVLSVRPGITGWWQVSARNEATWADGTRQALELEYVRNQGFAMDARCFFGTFRVMFGRSKTGR